MALGEDFYSVEGDIMGLEKGRKFGFGGNFGLDFSFFGLFLKKFCTVESWKTENFTKEMFQRGRRIP